MNEGTKRRKILQTIKNTIALNKELIPFGHGKPLRDTVIKREDIINLKIALNSAKSMEELFDLI